MADISKIKLPDGTTYDIKDATARNNSGVTGVKGNSESTYRTGNVNLTAANVGAVNKSGDTMTGGLTTVSNKYYENNTSNFGIKMSNSDIAEVNGIYFADKADGAGEGLNFYRDATHWDSFYFQDGVPYALPNREKGVAGTKQAMWTEKAYQAGTTDISIRPLVSRTRADRLAFLPADQIIIEKTTDGGTTWVDAQVSDDYKKALFVNGGGFSIPLLNNAKSTQCGVRVTITGMKYNVPNGTAETDKYNYWNSDYVVKQERYFNVREWWFWLSSNEDRIGCEIQRATGGNSTNWITVFNSDFRMSGWSGSDWIRAGNGQTFGGGVSQTANSWNWRLIFWSRPVDGSTTFASASAQSVSMIKCYGDNVWGNPNSLSTTDHLYSYDVNQNATFPAKVTAKGGFSGALTGNVTGNVSGTASNVTGTVAVANGGTGKTTTQAAANNLLGGLDNTVAQPTDNTSFITTSKTGATGTYYHRKASLLWDYIKGKISSVLGLTATNYGGTSAKATADASGNTISTYYAPKSTAVTNVALSTNKITKTINGTTTDVVTAATTSAYGITKLSTATNSTAVDVAATPSAVKTAYDLANSANTTANTALSGVNGNLIYDHTFTISNGVATFTPHVYQKGAEVTTNYAKSCFTWKYRLINGSEVNLTTNNDRGCTVTISSMGYGGHVIGIFTPS